MWNRNYEISKNVIINNKFEWLKVHFTISPHFTTHFLCFLRMINVQLFLVKNYFHFYSSRKDAGPRGKLLLKFYQNIGCHSAFIHLHSHTHFFFSQKALKKHFQYFQHFSIYYSIGQYISVIRPLQNHPKFSVTNFSKIFG